MSVPLDPPTVVIPTIGFYDLDAALGVGLPPAEAVAADIDRVLRDADERGVLNPNIGVMVLTDWRDALTAARRPDTNTARAECDRPDYRQRYGDRVLSGDRDDLVDEVRRLRAELDRVSPEGPR